MFKKHVALVGGAISEKCMEGLAAHGIDAITLPPYERLGSAVASHADLLALPLDRKIFVYGEYTERNEIDNRLSSTGCELIKIPSCPADKYPEDVGLNALLVGRRLFARLDCLSYPVSEYARKAGYELINIRQGYARCTAIPLSDNAVITADPSIAAAAEYHGIELLRISSGGVSLRGYDYGFIGGACGVLEDRVFFAGDLSSHPDGEGIAEFCERHGKTAVSLSNEPLCDVGSILFVG